MARQQEAFQQRLAKRGRSRGTSSNIGGLGKSVSHANFGLQKNDRFGQAVKQEATSPSAALQIKDVSTF